MRFCAALILFFASAASAWDVNDVSILLPLASTLASSGVLRPSTQGKAGELLPARFLGMLPLLSESSAAFPNQSLAVVGVRIDPCFPGIANPPEPCHFQIRMVWQPMFQVGANLEAMDAAVHTFYELTSGEFTELSQKIAVLNAKSGLSTKGLPLGVHPLIASQGLSGSYWQELSSIILSYTGEARLVRFTFMSSSTADMMWDFGGFDITPQKITRMVIPRIQTRDQSFVNVTHDMVHFNGGAKPEAPGDVDTFSRIVANSGNFTPEDSAIVKASVESIYRIENPTIHSPATVDCASCHTAEPARLWAISVFSELHLDQSQYRFQSAFNLQNTTESGSTTHLLRAFGYDGKTPAISQRTINESAAVAGALNAKSK